MALVDPWFRNIILSKFFTKGWGNPDHIRRVLAFRKLISNRETCQQLVSDQHPVIIDKEVVNNGIRTINGHFLSPFAQVLPGVMPRVSEIAKFQMLVPEGERWASRWGEKMKPVCIHMAGTGDHGFMIRSKRMAYPLLKEAGIASIMIENPYYGDRKPEEQFRSGLLHVNDLFVMGGALVLEALVLYHWCRRSADYGPMALTGISKGGFMSSLAGCNWPEPVSLVPCMSWSTASATYTRGALSGSVGWKALQEQFLHDSVYQHELSKYIYSPEDNNGRINEDFLEACKGFLETYPENKCHIDLLSRICKGELKSPRLASHYKVVRDTSKRKVLHKENTLQAEPVINTAMSNFMPSQIPLPSMEQFQKYTIDARNFVDSMVEAKLKHSDVSSNVMDFMRSVMDECTHLGNYDVPVDPELIRIVSAKHDLYIPKDNVLSLKELWPGAEVREMDTDHIRACFFRHKTFREAIIESFDVQVAKYYSDRVS